MSKETSSLLLVPRGRRGELRPGAEADRGGGVAPAQEAAVGSQGLLGLTWIKGTLSIIAMGFQGEGKAGLEPA